MRKIGTLAILCQFCSLPLLADDGSMLEIQNLYFPEQVGKVSQTNSNEYGCKRLPPTQDRCNKNKDEVLQISGTGCYVCKNIYCGSGHVVAVAGRATIRNNGGTYTDSLYECYRGAGLHNDKWKKIGPIPYCTGAESRKNDNNAEKRLFNITAGISYDITNGASVSVASSSDVCFDYACKEGYTRIDETNFCVKLNAQCTDKDGKKHTTGSALLNQNCATANADATTTSKLTSISNVKTDGLCKLTCADGGWSITLNDDACVNKYQPDSTKKQCVKTQATINDDNAAVARRNKCTNSGGTWSGKGCECDAEKNLRLFNGECVCTDSNYQRNGDKCVLTDPAQQQKDCEAAANTGAYWDNGECKCENPQHEWRDKKCVLSATFTATQTVNNAYSQLTSIHNKFRDDVSGWKNAEGKFNTARLASDSIAGVVLGTAGGLITSSVVKKNQVENGFEDIKCTIGGQNVAEWGDQFRVGIQ